MTECPPRYVGQPLFRVHKDEFGEVHQAREPITQAVTKWVFLPNPGVAPAEHMERLRAQFSPDGPWLVGKAS